jgi:aspartate kinase
LFGSKRHGRLGNIFAIGRGTSVRHREIWKFGGTSVDDADKRQAIGEKIAQADHLDVVVVVSAAAGMTDALHQEIGSPAEVPQHLIDSYVATGEMMSAPLVAAAIHAAGRPTAVVPATQLFSCDNRFGNGTVQVVHTGPILSLLRQHVVPVVGGFFGLSADGRLITLGRGGSDYSAVLLAAALGCDVCLFKASCDGVYDADPNRVAVARRYESLTHDQACHLAANGAKVLQSKASDLARAHKVTIRVRSAFAEGFGTVIKAC